MLTCTKNYKDIPIAHRQSAHSGHCGFIHGHNLSITFEFGCHTLDENGFVIDLGKLKYIQAWLDENFDHACLFNENDPLRQKLVQEFPEAFKVYILENCSCEGIARHLHDIFSKIVKEKYNDRVFIRAITVQETDKNKARFQP